MRNLQYVFLRIIIWLFILVTYVMYLNTGSVKHEILLQYIL